MKRRTSLLLGLFSRGSRRVLNASFLVAGMLAESLAYGQVATTPLPENQPPPSKGVGLDDITLPASASVNNSLGVSGDYLVGYGKIAMPFGFGLASAIGGNSGGPFQRVYLPNNRQSTYYGASLSYSYVQRWFLDFSYSKGSSTADVPQIQIGPGNIFKTVQYTIDDSWYQFYLRYALPKINRFLPYIRVGLTYVDSTLTTPLGSWGNPIYKYGQSTGLTDTEGNLGFGAAFVLLEPSPKLRLSLFGETEGFAGTRSQDIVEYLTPSSFSQYPAHLGNLEYGGLGRGSLRLEYFPKGLWRLFLDAGVQYRFTRVEYGDIPANPQTGNPDFVPQTHGEVLWGPFVKAGVKFSW